MGAIAAFLGEDQTHDDRASWRSTQGPSLFADLIRTVFPLKAEAAGTTLMLTAPHRGCGVSYASSCIVAELAPSNAKVLLADAHSLALLRHAETAFSRCERIGPGRVWILGHRQSRAGDPDFYKSVVSPLAVLEALRQEFTHIVIDTPALDESELALLFATAVTGVVLVVRAGHTEAQAITESCKQLTSLGAHIFGSVYSDRWPVSLTLKNGAQCQAMAADEPSGRFR